MRQATDEQTKLEVSDLYLRIQQILNERDLKWTDLSRMIGMKPKTLSSMKAQNVNPSFITVHRIAKALDVSLDELVAHENRTDELFELYWAIPRYVNDRELQGMICKQYLAMTYAVAPDQNTSHPHRKDVIIKDQNQLLQEIKNKSDT